MIIRMLLTVGAWMVILVLSHAVPPTAGEVDPGPTDITVPANASLELNISHVGIPKVSPPTRRPNLGSTRADDFAPFKGHFAGPVGLLGRNSCKDAIRISGSVRKPVITRYSDAVIYGALKKGLCWIARAVVYAEVKYNKMKVKVRLYDDGVGADKYKDDGTYSATVINYFGRGQYRVQLKAMNGSPSIVVDPTVQRLVPAFQRLGGGSERTQATLRAPVIQLLQESPIVASRRSPLVDEQLIGVKTTPFEGSRPIGLFTVEADLEDDKVPPDQIHDLKADPANVSNGQSGVMLTWRSTGAHGSEGTADKYDLRMSLDGPAFASNFDIGIPVQDPRDLITGTLKPAPSRTYEQIAVAVPPELLQQLPSAKQKATVHIKLVIVNKEGIRSEPSNLVDADVWIPRKFAKKRILNPSAEASRTVSPSPTDNRATSSATRPNQDIKKHSFPLLKYFALVIAAIVLLSTLAVGAAIVNSIATLTEDLEVPVEGEPRQASNVRLSPPRYDGHTATSSSRSSHKTRDTSFESASAT